MLHILFFLMIILSVFVFSYSLEVLISLSLACIFNQFYVKITSYCKKKFGQFKSWWWQKLLGVGINLYQRVSVHTVCFFVAKIMELIDAGMTAIMWSNKQMLYLVQKLFIWFGSRALVLIMLISLLLCYLCDLFMNLIIKFTEEISEIYYSGVSSVKTFISMIFAVIFTLVALADIFYQSRMFRNLKNWYLRQNDGAIRFLFLFVLFFLSFHVHYVCPLFNVFSPLQVPSTQGKIIVCIVLVISMSYIAITLRSRAKSKKKDSIIGDEKYCVICQERNRCILLLPCRHLCLCAECNMELGSRTLNCPICRTNIDSTLEIYL